MAKRRKQTEPIEGSCAALIPRIERLENVIRQHFGVGIEEISSNPEDNPVVEEKRYDRSVIKIHKSGAIEYLRICEWCGTEVADLATHKAKCPQRPIF